jgi:hypothetical protein
MSAKKAALRAAFFFCAAAAALLIPFPELKSIHLRPALFHGLEDMGHPVIFALLAFLVAAAVRTRRGTLHPRHAAWLLVTLSAFGGLSEVLQHFTGRDASFTDFINDVLGTWIGIALFHLMRGGIGSARKRRALVMSLVAAILLAVLPLAWTLSGYAYRYIQRPVIWRAHSRLLDQFVQRNHGEYPGLALTELPPDWRGFRELLITVRNPGRQTARFFVRANDLFHNQRYEDRYHGEFVITAATTQTYRISLQEILNAPATRRMDISKMTSLVVFETRANGVHDIDVLEIALAN